MKRMAISLFASSIVACCMCLSAEPVDVRINTVANTNSVSGRVISVADGDTITIIGDGNAQYKIRLNAIDAPEKSQDFGQKSKQQLSNYVFGKDITVTWKSKDKYGIRRRERHQPVDGARWLRPPLQALRQLAHESSHSKRSKMI